MPNATAPLDGETATTDSGTGDGETVMRKSKQ